MLVLDMGEPVGLLISPADWLLGSPWPVDIVFTGLRPGEKLVEDLLGHDEVDHRPHHPLIGHARVTALHPERLKYFDLSATQDCSRKARPVAWMTGRHECHPRRRTQYHHFCGT